MVAPRTLDRCGTLIEKMQRNGTGVYWYQNRSHFRERLHVFPDTNLLLKRLWLLYSIVCIHDAECGLQRRPMLKMRKVDPYYTISKQNFAWGSVCSALTKALTYF